MRYTKVKTLRYVTLSILRTLVYVTLGLTFLTLYLMFLPVRLLAPLVSNDTQVARNDRQEMC